jgi:hypothetical protein
MHFLEPAAIDRRCYPAVSRRALLTGVSTNPKRSKAVRQQVGNILVVGMFDAENISISINNSSEREKLN